MPTEAPKFARVGAVGRCMAHPASYKNDAAYSYETNPPMKRIAALALRKLEEARALDIAQHEINGPFIEANRTARARIQALMDELGVPKSFSEPDTKSRARFPKRITMDAGYLGDMRRNFPVDDGFDMATTTYLSLKAKYDAYALEAEGEAARLAAARAAEEERQKAARRANIEMATIILRYGLDVDSTWSDILDALRKRDQRLDLACAMQLTRGDWSDGYYRVSDALDRFIVKTPEDAAIQTDILSCFNEDIDGRVFRDTTWSYGALFAGAEDQQLSTDIQLALSKAGND